MACPLCGDPCNCSHAGASSGVSCPVLLEAEHFDQPGAQYHQQPIAVGQSMSTSMSAESYAAEDLHTWRAEVSSRVKAHRRRRGYADVDSLSMDFAEATPDFQPTVAEEHQLVEEEIPAPTPPPESRYRRIAMKRAQAELESGNLIEFPRTSTVEMFPEELAEPLPSMPRILEAPEPVQDSDIPGTFSEMFASIQLDVSEEEQDELTAKLELPLQVAPISPRAMSAAIDGVLVLTGAALFTVVVLSISKFVPQGKLLFTAAILLPSILWAAYHYLFLVYSGFTPGMQMAQLELTSFDGCLPSRRTRASRALAMLLSFASLGMGFLWSMIDEDSLAWHDRITRTYLRQS